MPNERGVGKRINGHVFSISPHATICGFLNGHGLIAGLIEGNGDLVGTLACKYACACRYTPGVGGSCILSHCKHICRA